MPAPASNCAMWAKWDDRFGQTVRSSTCSKRCTSSLAKQQSCLKNSSKRPRATLNISLLVEPKGEAIIPKVSIAAAQRVRAGKRQSLKTMTSFDRGWEGKRFSLRRFQQIASMSPYVKTINKNVSLDKHTSISTKISRKMKSKHGTCTSKNTCSISM
jgi:hypothetical protein